MVGRSQLPLDVSEGNQRSAVSSRICKRTRITTESDGFELHGAVRSWRRGAMNIAARHCSRESSRLDVREAKHSNMYLGSRPK